MLTLERREAIMERLRSQHTVKVESLAKELFISEATVRRDLSQLEREGLLKRSYGGAMLLEGKDRETPLLLRQEENRSAKDRVAEIAVSLIADNSILMLDSSSTVMRLVPLLARFERLTAITHGLKTALMLHELSNVSVYCTGGRLQENTFSMVGPSACERIECLNADIAFLSCRGFSLTRGITDASEEEAQIKRSMMAASQKKVLLFDDSKFERPYLIRVCEAEDFSAVICNQPLPREALDELERRGVPLLTAESDSL